MKLAEFREQLVTTHAYETPPDLKRSWLDRCLGWSDVWIYFRIVQVVASGNRLARRGLFSRQCWAEHALAMLSAIEGGGGRVRIHDVGPVAALSGPAVFASNHMSIIETLLLPLILLQFADVTTVVKSSLLDYPLFGRILRVLKPISVERKNPRDDLKTVLKEGEEALKRGVSVVLFPQSTRSVRFDPAAFNSLGMKLAKRADVPLVPVAVKTDFQGIGRVFRDLGPFDRGKMLHFRIGSPLRIAGNGRAEHAAVVRFIEESLAAW